MALEKLTRDIGGITYEVTQFGAKLGNRVLLKVVKSLAPLFAVAASAGALKDLDASSVAGSLSGISEDDFEWLIEQFAAATTLQLGDRAPSLKSIYDLHFAGKYLDQLAWLAFAIEVNYGPFFQEMKRKAEVARKAVEVAREKAASSSTSPSTSTGPANAS